MLEEDMEVAIKVVVVGNGAVGKSSMIQRYCKGIFTKDYKKTIGVDFLERQIQYVLNRCRAIHFYLSFCFFVLSKSKDMQRLETQGLQPLNLSKGTCFLFWTEG